MHRQFPLTIIILVAVFLLSACIGCGPARPQTVPVAGRVTYQGKPVPEGRITFLPDHGRPAIGTIQTDGSYRLTTFQAGDGVLPGHYRVTIESMRVSRGSQPKSLQDELRMGMGDVSAMESLVPQIFSSPHSSTLTAEVKKGENTINFDL